MLRRICRGLSLTSSTAAPPSALQAATSPNRGGIARSLRRAAAVDRVEDQTDHLRADEEDLRAVGQADEQIEAAENSDRRDERRRGSAELALGVGLAPAQDEHRRANC